MEEGERDKGRKAEEMEEIKPNANKLKTEREGRKARIRSHKTAIDIERVVK